MDSSREIVQMETDVKAMSAGSSVKDFFDSRNQADGLTAVSVKVQTAVEGFSVSASASM